MSQLPRLLLFGFIVVFCLQLAFHHSTKNSQNLDYRALEKPLPGRVYRGIAMGSESLLSHLLAIKLQLHDNQAGKHIRYDKIDYQVLVEWLTEISKVDQTSEYQLMLASRVYSQTRDDKRLRLLLGYIESQFIHDPQRHWRRVTEASLIAKHKLKDLDYALRLAELVSSQPENIKMPHWARDFQFLLLAQLNELESAIAIIQALINSNSIEDVDENVFLRLKLSEFQQKLFESQQPAPE